MRIYLLSVVATMTLILGSCYNDGKAVNNQQSSETVKDVREIAWNSLSKNEKEEVIGDWKDAEVSTVLVDEKRFALTDKSYVDKEVTIVTFHSKKSAILGDISKLLDKKTHTVIGGAYRD
ncbi:hypothetical protein [Neobacillus drentensis]|uniref:hypothetical protein n=1 Tax=Neobacillus drentensis TaxID=220684 RepID=UPI002FFF37F2